MIRIFLVDDSATARQALKTVIEQRSEWVVVAEACNGLQALTGFEEQGLDVTVMDFLMPEMNGLEAAGHLTQLHPEAPILLITTDPTHQLETEARKVGIRGLCPKSKMYCVLGAIEALLAGHTYFNEAVAA